FEFLFYHQKQPLQKKFLICTAGQLHDEVHSVCGFLCRLQNQTYEILSDPDKRARYDQYGHSGINDQDFNFDDFAQGGFGGFEDIFNMF
ncbi:hypothetical protein ACMYLW_23095, partial [Salmonella enterica subsp. enterica serovar Enteritidis]